MTFREGTICLVKFSFFFILVNSLNAEFLLYSSIKMVTLIWWLKGFLNCIVELKSLLIPIDIYKGSNSVGGIPLPNIKYFQSPASCELKTTSACSY